MPDQLAHFLFAKRVYAQLPPALQARINADSAAFRAGTFGPDPLFNDANVLRREEGFRMHRMSGAALMERMRPSLRRDMPDALDYAAGFFCHYALDRICHPELIRRHRLGPDRHVAMETAYDRILYLRGERGVSRRMVFGESVCRAACEIYRLQTPESFRRDLNGYCRLRRLLLSVGGTPLAAASGCIKPEWKGVIPEKHPSEGVKSAIEMLDEKINGSASPVAAQLERLIEAFDAEATFDPWLSFNFKGEPASDD